MRKNSASPAAPGEPLAPPTSADGEASQRAVAQAGGEVGAGFVVASHEVLFEQAAEPRCDVCGAPVRGDDEGDDGYDVPGSGVYLWSRGGEVEWEGAPLCASCASAIGMTALARWETEEDEG